MTSTGTLGIESALRTQTVRDTFHNSAVEAGLVHSGGHGNYSEFTGTAAQWEAMSQGVRECAHLYPSSSVRAVLRRIDWARA